MFILSSVTAYSHGVSCTVWTHDNHAGVSFIFPVISFFLYVVFSLILSEPQNNNAFDCTRNWVVLFSSSFSTILWHVGVFPCAVTNVCVCLDICGCVCQCLQRIWKRASGRWRGSCCSWRETWRLSPPPMTPTTCSSLKWLYPLHTHAFTHSPAQGIIQWVYCTVLYCTILEFICLHLTRWCCGW